MVLVFDVTTGAALERKGLGKTAGDGRGDAYEIRTAGSARDDASGQRMPSATGPAVLALAASVFPDHRSGPAKRNGPATFLWLQGRRRWSGDGTGVYRASPLAWLSS